MPGASASGGNWLSVSISSQSRPQNMASVCAAIACSAWMQNIVYSSDWRRGFDLASIYSNPFCNYRNGASKVPQSSTVPKRPYGKGQAPSADSEATGIKV